MRRTLPRQEKPYLDSERIATPYPNSLRSAYYERPLAFLYCEGGGCLYLMPTNFELGHIPRCVLVCRSLYVPKLRLIGRKIVMNVQWQFDCLTVRTSYRWSDNYAHTSRTRGVHANQPQHQTRNRNVSCPSRLLWNDDESHVNFGNFGSSPVIASKDI